MLHAVANLLSSDVGLEYAGIGDHQPDHRGRTARPGRTAGAVDRDAPATIWLLLIVALASGFSTNAARCDAAYRTLRQITTALREILDQR